MTESRCGKLSDRQCLFLQISAAEETKDPGPVRLMSASDWRTARSLVRAGLGEIEQPAGEQARFTTNQEGSDIVYPRRSNRSGRG